MKTIFKPVLAGIAAATLVAPVASIPATAQQVQGIGVVNVPAVVVNSQAYQTANTQRQTTYAAQLQQAQTRQQALNAQLQPLVTAFNTARQQANANQTSLQQQAQQIAQLRQNGQAELQQILGPVAMSQAYVEEQITDQLQAGIEAAAKARNVTMVVSPDSILYADNAYNMNEAVLAQLNRLLPNAQIVPPNGWLPRELREQQEAAAAAGAQQPAAQGR